MKKIMLLTLLVSTAVMACEDDALNRQVEQEPTFSCEQYVDVKKKKIKEHKDKVFFTPKQAKLIAKRARQGYGRSRNLRTLPDDLNGFDGCLDFSVKPRKGFKPKYPLEEILWDEELSLFPESGETLEDFFRCQYANAHTPSERDSLSEVSLYSDNDEDNDAFSESSLTPGDISAIEYLMEQDKRDFLC